MDWTTNANTTVVSRGSPGLEDLARLWKQYRPTAPSSFVCRPAMYEALLQTVREEILRPVKQLFAPRDALCGAPIYVAYTTRKLWEFTCRLARRARRLDQRPPCILLAHGDTDGDRIAKWIRGRFAEGPQ